MKIFLRLISITIVAVCLAMLFPVSFSSNEKLVAERKYRKDERARFQEARVRYEFEMLKDPTTGKIPYRIREQEMSFARQLPVKGYNPFARTTALNTYLPAGPNNIGGRTRALAYDIRYNGTSNRVILAGCVSGGIMRSADGGATWTLVTPDADIHSLSAITQDPRSGQQDTWYAGGGEALGNSTSEIGASYMGYGIWKSTNNGVSWTKLPLNTITDVGGGTLGAGALEAFDHPFDFVHNIAVNPTNGHVYIAGHRRLVRTTNGGATFQVVFGGTVGAIASAGQMDVAITDAGKVLLAVNGGSPELGFRGVWVSSTGNLNSYTRIAGGPTLGTDSVANWRGNSYQLISAGTYSSKRILIGLAPSNNNLAYVLYENGLSNEAPDLKPEVDLFHLDMTSGNVWTNLSANMPDLPTGNLTGSDPLAVQGGYDMIVRVKPDNPNVVFVGGTNLYRSTDGFATINNIAWIDGYRQSPLDYGLYPNGHPDLHSLAFNPSNPNEAIAGDDGGIRITTNIAAGSGPWPSSPVVWTPLPNYQTLQYYHITMDPEAGRNNFAGGSQDNGTRFRDKLGILGTATADSNNHAFLISGDGGGTQLSKLSMSDQNQYLYASTQYGNIRRVRLTNGVQTTGIRPNGLTPSFTGSSSEFGEFVTNFKLDMDNSEDLYYVNFNRLFRTTSASTVTAGGWTELTGVSLAINPSNGRNIGIRALAFTRGDYTTNHSCFIGTTDGRIFRLDNPRNTDATTAPVNITPGALAGNVQDIATNPNNDDEVMAVVSNYGVVSIWWTNNAKSVSPTWRNAEGNLTLPSARSCMIVVKKDASNNPVTEYYVGTSVGLYSAVDIGTTLTGGGTPTWQREGAGTLNYAVIQSLAYRPQDNVMVLGTHGNGMYYTNLGTPNFTPNITGFDPVINDKNFITKVFPTIGREMVYYRTGNLFTVKKINVQVFNMSGQELIGRRDDYQSGSIDISRLPGGTYILSILSEDRKYRHLQKIIKQ